MTEFKNRFSATASIPLLIEPCCRGNTWSVMSLRSSCASPYNNPSKPQAQPTLTSTCTSHLIISVGLVIITTTHTKFRCLTLIIDHSHCNKSLFQQHQQFESPSRCHRLFLFFFFFFAFHPPKLKWSMWIISVFQCSCVFSQKERQYAGWWTVLAALIGLGSVSKWAELWEQEQLLHLKASGWISESALLMLGKKQPNLSRPWYKLNIWSDVK